MQIHFDRSFKVKRWHCNASLKQTGIGWERGNEQMNANLSRSRAGRHSTAGNRGCEIRTGANACAPQMGRKGAEIRALSRLTSERTNRHFLLNRGNKKKYSRLENLIEI
jgi:hypothetical protein